MFQYLNEVPFSTSYVYSETIGFSEFKANDCLQGFYAEHAMLYRVSKKKTRDV